MILQVAYELRSSEKDYSDLYEFLEKGMGQGSIHVLRDVWWVNMPYMNDATSKSFQDLLESIKSRMDTADVFYITPLYKDQINGYMGTPVWDWYFKIMNSELGQNND